MLCSVLLPPHIYKRGDIYHLSLPQVTKKVPKEQKRTQTLSILSYPIPFYHVLSYLSTLLTPRLPSFHHFHTYRQTDRYIHTQHPNITISQHRKQLKEINYHSRFYLNDHSKKQVDRSILCTFLHWYDEEE